MIATAAVAIVSTTLVLVPPLSLRETLSSYHWQIWWTVEIFLLILLDHPCP